MMRIFVEVLKKRVIYNYKYNSIWVWKGRKKPDKKYI